MATPKPKRNKTLTARVDSTEMARFQTYCRSIGLQPGELMRLLVLRELLNRWIERALQLPDDTSVREQIRALSNR